MRQIHYSVAMSLDGYIAGPKGEADWIVMDPDLGPAFRELYSRFDTLLVGRKTFEAMAGKGGGGSRGFKVFVFSNTLKAADHPGVTVVSGDVKKAVTDLKEAPGKDIWLFGGGGLFHSLLDLGLVDRVGVGVIPVLLGGGIPLLPAPAARTSLALTSHKVYPKTGTVALEYAVKPPKAARRTRARAS
jgi:dihydrofolate reductase